MIDVNQLRRGVTFLHDGNLLKVTEYSHSKPGRGKATIRVQVRNMRSGANLNVSFTSGDRVEDVRLDKRQVQYSYNDGQFHVFMDSETFEQYMIAYETIGDDQGYLLPGMEMELLFYETEVLDYLLPLNADYEVVETENAVAGDTATGATKEVILETGLKVKTPLFVNVGDRIKVDTRSGEYVTRA